MNWMDLPPLSSLRALAALAHTGSVSAAGAALNVSHAAVSQQIRALEAELGEKLTQKSGRSVALTPSGERLARSLLSAFGTMFEAVAEFSAQDAVRPVQVSMTPMFAATWMMPRLSSFRQAHPEIELMINPTPDVVDLVPGGVDLAIRFGDGHWPGLEAERFIDTDFVVVGAASLLSARTIARPSDLAALPWLQEVGTNEVNRWLSAQGVTETAGLKVIQIPGFMMLNAIRSGDGVAATARAFVQDDLDAGRLITLFELSTEDAGYHLVTRPGIMRPPLRTFHRWLKRQNAQDAKKA